MIAATAGLRPNGLWVTWPRSSLREEGGAVGRVRRYRRRHLNSLFDGRVSVRFGEKDVHLGARDSVEIATDDPDFLLGRRHWTVNERDTSAF